MQGKPRKKQGFFSSRNPQILGKQRRSAPTKQGKSETEKSKEIQKSKGCRGCLPITINTKIFAIQQNKILRGINFVKITKNTFQRRSRIWPLLFGFCAISTRLPEERMGVTKKKSGAATNSRKNYKKKNGRGMNL